MSQMAELLESFPKSDSPIQYLKKVRLVKAKDLMVQEGMKAYIAADRVGYEGSSQFSLEFKRYFGQNPQPGAAARRRQQTAGPCQPTAA